MESKVNAQLAKTGTFFQSYIRRGLANLEAEANAAAANGGSSASSAGGAGGLTGSPTVRDREVADIIAARKRESVLSLANSESGMSTTGSLSADPSESYKDRLARLQQMFGYKSVSLLKMENLSHSFIFLGQSAAADSFLSFYHVMR